MKNIILDTNVLVSAILKDKAPERIIKFVIAHPDYTWVASRDILSEYFRVLRRKKFSLSTSRVKRWMALIQDLVKLYDKEVRVTFERDKKDEKFLSCALASNADFLVTGDLDFVEAEKMLNTRIESVALIDKLVIEENN